MVDNISGWWYTHPPEKYESQIGSSSQLLGKKTCSKPPTSMAYCWLKKWLVVVVIGGE